MNTTFQTKNKGEKPQRCLNVLHRTKNVVILHFQPMSSRQRHGV
jgi:hypothetical protein